MNNLKNGIVTYLLCCFHTVRFLKSEPHESLGFSPVELLYGQTVRGPMQILRELWTGENLTEEVKTTSEYVVDLRNRIEETCKNR